MTARPTSAVVLSSIGGLMTLGLGLVSIISWFGMYSISGSTFTFNLVGGLDFTAEEALVLFVLAAVGGVLIEAGAVLQYSGVRSKVRVGSLLMVIGSILGALGTFFGYVIGGLLSVGGAVSGLSWKPPRKSFFPSGTDNINPH